jgi:hypothetical protein
MVKPVLPREISSYLPVDVVRVIYSYVPHMPKPIETPGSSPNLQKELNRLQSRHLNGASNMYMYELDDFMLDGYCQKAHQSKGTKSSLRKVSI